ncbi:GrpB family protein [Mediterraneibacter catenae]|uniref:GrpB family protein n=1 Tax=Mediterraneibacter catenae TaxID=2594882 RepID=A0A5M9I1F7_9FIRM|nr:GrpB family protein [Mediterraneibacter catenae]KAA8501311.1 GrpB family protein [Mediterraneibacter catenae]
MARKIEVVDYRPEWDTMFKVESKKIKKILGKNCVGVYHIGSTSVKGLPAKPIIDIMPVVKDISLVDAHNGEFEALGYECRGEFGILGRRFFAKGGDNRTHHIHIFEQSNQTDIQRHIAVRDYLNAHSDTAAEYAALKKKLAAEFPFDNDGYCDGKEEYMKSLEEKALHWQKKQNRISLGISLDLMFGIAFGFRDKDNSRQK